MAGKAPKKTSVVNLEPAILLFHLPGANDPSRAGAAKAEAVTAQLKISNPTNSSIKFKVKTTAPKKYCVKPNSGELAPESFETVAVMLQPEPNTKALPLPTPDCRDKFLVQTVMETDCIKDHWVSSDLWKLIPEEKIMSDKMKCAWKERAADSAPAPAPAAPAARQPAGAAAANTIRDARGGAGPATAIPAAKPVVKTPAAVAPLPAAGKTPAARAPAAAAASPVVGKAAGTFGAAAPAARSSGGSTAVARAPESNTDAKLYILVLVFVLGVVFGKFLL